MQQFLAFTFSGLTTAAIYAIVASGLVLTYTTTGVFNFAQGAMAMIGAFVYWQLRFAWEWPAPLALAVTLGVLAPMFGWGVARLMRGVQGMSETITLVASLGLLLGLVGVAQFIWDPVRRRPMRAFFDGNRVELLGVGIPWDQLIAMALAGLVALGLWLLMRRSRTGVAMRAAVDDPALATLTGARPARSAALAWALGASLAALSGILVAPTIQLNALQLSLLVVNAYGAAAIGRLRSIPMTFLGALVLGLGRDYFIGYKSLLPAGFEPYIRGFAAAIPALVLLVVTLVLPAARLRGRAARTREMAHRPTWRGSFALAAGVVVATAMVAPLLSESAALNAGAIWGTAIVALSLVPLVGMSGQLSLAQLSFAGIGAVAYAHLGLDNPLGLLWAALWAGGIGVLVALPTVRLAGVYLALATGAVAVVLDQWIFVMPEITILGHDFFLFEGGSLRVGRPSLLGLSLADSRAYFLYSAVIFAALALLVVAIRRSAFGQRLIAVKEAPAAATTVGVDVARTRLAVFALSAAIAGVGGAVMAGSQQSAAQDGFSFFAGLPILLVMVIGGASLPGSAVMAGLVLAGDAVMAMTPFGPLFSTSSDNVIRSIGIGAAALGLARDPNGSLTGLREAFRPVGEQAAVLVGLLVSVVVAWALCLAGVIGETTLGWVLTALLLAAPAAALARRRRQAATGAATARPALSAEPELLGLTAPFRAEDVAALDGILRLPARPAAGAVSRV